MHLLQCWSLSALLNMCNSENLNNVLNYKSKVLAWNKQVFQIETWWIAFAFFYQHTDRAEVFCRFFHRKPFWMVMPRNELWYVLIVRIHLCGEGNLIESISKSTKARLGDISPGPFTVIYFRRNAYLSTDVWFCSCARLCACMGTLNDEASGWFLTFTPYCLKMTKSAVNQTMGCLVFSKIRIVQTS